MYDILGAIVDGVLDGVLDGVFDIIIIYIKKINIGI
jgi:hypothetical protein